MITYLSPTSEKISIHPPWILSSFLSLKGKWRKWRDVQIIPISSTSLFLLPLFPFFKASFLYSSSFFLVLTHLYATSFPIFISLLRPLVGYIDLPQFVIVLSEKSKFRPFQIIIKDFIILSI